MKNTRINIFAAVTMATFLTNSLNVKVTPYFLSTASKITTLLAAPKIVFLAIVLPIYVTQK